MLQKLKNWIASLAALLIAPTLLAFLLIILLPWIISNVAAKHSGDYSSVIPLIDAWDMIVFIPIVGMLATLRSEWSAYSLLSEESSGKRDIGNSMVGVGVILFLIFCFRLFYAGIEHEEIRGRSLTYSVISAGPHCAYAYSDDKHFEKCYGRESSSVDFVEYYPRNDPFYHLRAQYDALPAEYKECLDDNKESFYLCWELHPANSATSSSHNEEQ